MPIAKSNGEPTIEYALLRFREGSQKSFTILLALGKGIIETKYPGMRLAPIMVV